MTKQSASAEIVAALRRVGASYEPDHDALIGLSGSESAKVPDAVKRFRYRADGTVLPPIS